MKTINSIRSRQAGFTIVEALIALIIMGFGIFALAGVQISLSRNADDAKQRTEAVRLAQEKIESLRSYTGIATTVVGQGTVSTSAQNWNNLASGTDTITNTSTYNTNTSYLRTWTLGGTAADPMRALTVNVSWTDRANVAQAVALATVLSKTDPADSGFLSFPLPLNTNLKRPKNRNLDIPIPAIDLGTGSSAIKFGGNGQYLVFDNISGNVIQICAPTSLPNDPTTAQIIAALTNTSINRCTSVTGFIVAGYVQKHSQVPSDVWDSLGIDYSRITRNAAGSTGINCQFGNAKNQSTGEDIEGYKYYICVVPLVEPSPPLTASGPYNWSGKILLAGPTAWHASGNKYYVCRYQYEETSNLTDVNQRNVQPYVNVNLSIDQQNYWVGITDSATSTTAPTCPSSMNVADVSVGVLHQDCRSASNAANFAADCPLVGATTQSTLTYNGNTQTSGVAPVDSNSPYTTNATVTTLAQGSLLKTNNNFAGWNTAANGTGTSYAAGASFSIAGNTTLYAKWTARLTYDGNGSTGGTTPLDAGSPYISGATVSALGQGSLVKVGNNFTNWNTAANGSGTSYPGGSSFTITGNTTLYAQWSTAPVTYTIIYSGNGNTGGDAPSGGSYASGATVTTPAQGTLVKANNTFAGWNTAANGTGTSYAAGATFAIMGNTVLYAQWRPITYALTYNGNGSTGGTVPTGGSYAAGTPVTAAGPGTLVKTGYAFTGWNTVAGGTGTSYAAGATLTMTAVTTLYAQWTSAIRLDTPGPSWTGTNDPKKLTWSAVPNATGYLVGSCSTANKNDLTSCAPVAGTTPQTGLSVSPTPANKATYCYNVVARGLSPYTDSYTSSTFCIHVAGQSYTYTP